MDTPDNNRVLIHIFKNTTCLWTKGYVEGALNLAPTLQSIIARASSKIDAIKMLREHYNISLKEAKEIADQYFS